MPDGRCAPYAPVWRASDGQTAAAPIAGLRPHLQRLLNEMPAAVRQTFTLEQIACLESALRPKPSPHKIDWRVSIPVFGRRYYLTVFFGRERRSLTRLLEEGQIDLSRISATYAAAIGIGGALLFLVCVLVGYVLKSALGIDLQAGDSALHQMIYEQSSP